MTRIATAGSGTVVLTIAGSDPARHNPDIASPTVYRLSSNRSFHVVVGRGEVDAAVTDALVPNGCEYVRVNVGEQISVIKAVGETDGQVWLTRQREEG